MSKQVSVDDLNAVHILGRRQRIYTRDCVPAQQAHIPQQKMEVVTERVELPTGFYEQLVEREYPVNSESVSSYADTADYRNDPLGAIAQAPKRVNLGDITGLQDFVNGDPQRAVSVYKNVLAQVSKYLDTVAKQQTKQPPKEEESTGGKEE